MENNQRQFERVSTSQTIVISHHEHEDAGKMIDISQQGSGLIADTPIDEGECICLKFTLPTSSNRTPFEVEAIVIHSNKIRHQYLVGVTFSKMDATHQAAIREYIARHHAMKY